MGLEEDIAETFRRHEWVWHLKGGKYIVPEADDIESALDEAARLLYNEEVGAQLEVGRLIIRRLHNGFDVYVYAGQYE